MTLTKKQEIFATEYVKLDDASAAYRIAYDTSKMKNKSVWELSSTLLKNIKVASRVAELKNIAKEIAEKEFQIDSKAILRHLNILRLSRIDEYVVFAVIDKVIGIDEETDEEIKIKEQVLQFKPFDELTEEQLMCIESIKDTRNGIELKLHGKDWTIDKIAKHIGFYEEHNKQKQTQRIEIDYSKMSDKQIEKLLEEEEEDNN